MMIFHSFLLNFRNWTSKSECYLTNMITPVTASLPKLGKWVKSNLTRDLSGNSLMIDMAHQIVEFGYVKISKSLSHCWFCDQVRST